MRFFNIKEGYGIVVITAVVLMIVMIVLVNKSAKSALEALILQDVIIEKVEFISPKPGGFMSHGYDGATILTIKNYGVETFSRAYVGFIPLNKGVNIHYNKKYGYIMNIEVVNK